MNKEPHISEDELLQIDQYLSGSLTETEKEIFEKRLATDPAWAEKVQKIKLISVGIQESALRADLQKKNKKPDAAPVRNINWLKRLSVAAVLLVAVSTLTWVFFFRPSADQKLFAAYYHPDAGLPTEMGVSDNYAFERAMVDYKRADYKAAISGWNGLLKQSPANDTLQYFIACAQMADNNPSAASTGFDAVIKQAGSVFTPDAYWYKGLLLLREGKKDAAVMSIERSAHPQKAALLHKLKE